MKPVTATLLLTLACLALDLSPASAAPQTAPPAETATKAARPPAPGDAGKAGSAAGMTNGSGPREGGAAGLDTQGRAGAAARVPAPR